MQAFRAPRVLACLVAVAVAVGPVGFAQTGSDQDPPQNPLGERSRVTRAERTDAGDWYGTWFYISRMFSMVIWIKEVDGEPRVKLRYQHRGTIEAFETDWESKADYEHRGKKGSFEIVFDQRDANTMSGSWTWRYGPDGTARIEDAKFQAYRAGNGREMVFNLTERNRRYEADGNTLDLSAPLNLRKVSKFQARWHEIPF